jgi:hypothetical protein
MFYTIKTSFWNANMGKKAPLSVCMYSNSTGLEVAHLYWTHRIKISADNEFYHPSGMKPHTSMRARKSYTHAQKKQIWVET